MQAFLPNGYRFTVNNMLNQHLYLVNEISEIIAILVIGILLTIFCSYIKYFITSRFWKISSYILMLVIILGSFSMASFIYINTFTKSPIAQPCMYSDQEFKFAAESNLYIKINDSYGLKNNEPKTRLDNTEYPYDIYISDDFDVYHDGLNHNRDADETNSRHYIGSMNHGKFKPNNTQFAAIFYKYTQYIKQNHLDNKFKKCAYFEYDARYMTNDHKPQIVLTNHKDTVLHFKDNATVKQLEVVKN